MRASAPVLGTALLLLPFLASSLLAVPLSEMDREWFQEQPMEMTWGPDPFAPKISESVVRSAPTAFEEPFILSAVLLNGEKPAAILNGTVVRTGDRIRKHTVLQITKGAIFLRGPSGTIEVALKPLFSLKDRTP